MTVLLSLEPIGYESLDPFACFAFLYVAEAPARHVTTFLFDFHCRVKDCKLIYVPLMNLKLGAVIQKQRTD